MSEGRSRLSQLTGQLFFLIPCRTLDSFPFFHVIMKLFLYGVIEEPLRNNLSLYNYFVTAPYAALVNELAVLFRLVCRTITDLSKIIV